MPFPSHTWAAQPPTRCQGGAWILCNFLSSVTNDFNEFLKQFFFPTRKSKQHLKSARALSGERYK